jgi:histidinol-phosphatase (PHP family)
VTRRYDVHVHTSFSPDGRDGLEAYARRVDEGFADGIGFTDHYEFEPGADRCTILDEAAYFADIQTWRDRGYDFWAGAEVDWVPECRAIIEDHLARHPFAYTIASVHNLPVASISGHDTWFAGPATQGTVLDQYHAAVASSLTVDAFDVVGHVGVYARHLGPDFWAASGLAPRVADLEDDLARQIARSGKLLEVNTSGLFCARGEPCAGRFLLERYRYHGGTRITLASDAHRADHLRRGFDRAAEMVQRAGFDHVFLPWNDEPVALENYL